MVLNASHEGSIKINVDASIVAEEKFISMGVVARGHKGLVITSLVFLPVCSDVVEVELRPCLAGLYIYWGLSAHKLAIFRDRLHVSEQ